MLKILLALAIGIVATEAESAVNKYTPFDKTTLNSTSTFEQFDYDNLNDSNWVVSKSPAKDPAQNIGVWNLEPATVYPGFLNDNALTMKSPASHYAISYKLSTPFDNFENDLVLQYEVKAQKGLNCGGAYIKLLDHLVDNDYAHFNSLTPYQIMFGPDKCGYSNKIHFIINRENPFTKSYEEKHLTLPPLARSGMISTLYTLILKKNQDFEIRVDGKVAKAGNLVEDLTLLNPPLHPPKEIIDVTDVQPEDWDDEEFIPDPEIVEKPADYDAKYYAFQISDPNAEMPLDWEEFETEYIIDPSAKIPSDWDEEEDGTWEGPLIKNPKCISNGCGKWTAPLIANPDYLGPWVRPLIKNPNYQGEWTPRLIPNKNFFVDSTPSNLKLIGGIGFELWSMDSDQQFNNIYLGHSISEAEIIGNQTFVIKEKLERESRDENQPKAKNEPIAPPESFDDLLSKGGESYYTQGIDVLSNVPIAKLYDIYDYFIEFKDKPIETIIKSPLKFVLHCVGFVFLFTFTFGILSVFVYLISGPVGESSSEIAVKSDLYSKNEEDDDEAEESKHSDSPKIEELVDDQCEEVISNKGASGFERSKN